MELTTQKNHKIKLSLQKHQSNDNHKNNQKIYYLIL